MHHKSKQRRQKAWDDGVAPGDNEPYDMMQIKMDIFITVF